MLLILLNNIMLIDKDVELIAEAYETLLEAKKKPSVTLRKA